MKTIYCPNCGSKLTNNVKFCSNCGNKIQVSFEENSQKEIRKIASSNPHAVIHKINKKITIENNQTSITKKLWYAAGFFLLIIFIALTEIIEIQPAIFFLSFFFFLSSVKIGFMFRRREKKLQTLITGENLVAEWTLTKEQKKSYVNYLFKHESGKNLIILFSIGSIAIVVFGVFILFIDEGKLAMFFVLLALIAFLSLFAFGMPFYYKIKNSRGDSNILIGAKYAYINGYFHNWDFPLSGLKKIKIMKNPFYGINLVYYYTDRTLSHSEELFIPAPKDIDLKKLIGTLKELNM
ncbi:zinc ribbon domain-containing protein [Lutibacter sp.]|uniref:zinc ribbon domain-containing protein n=1 Tax=Lutibacter sp. TaxID=1925666 RepID=UPI0025C713B6|nr:zinc ribbon domain-containing protein [Lutibacter sp.]MCF6169146.1 zinc ribbon domain-containing protein [Lutibacter sp.]